MANAIINGRFDLRRILTPALRAKVPNCHNYNLNDGPLYVKLREDIMLVFKYRSNQGKQVIDVVYSALDKQPRFLLTYSAKLRKSEIIKEIEMAFAGIMFDRLYLTRQLYFYHSLARSLGSFEFRHVIEEVGGDYGIAVQSILECRRIRYLKSCAHGDGKLPVFIG